MTYPHTLHGTGKRPDEIEERWSRFLFSIKHLVEKFRSVEALHGFEAPWRPYVWVPPTRVTHQCARLAPGFQSRAVAALGERYLARAEPGW